MAAGLLRLLARTAGGGWLALGSAAVLVLPVLARLLSPDLRRLVVERTWEPRGRVGEDLTFALVVRNGSRGTSRALQLTDEQPGFAPLRVAVPALRPGQQTVVTVRRTAHQRGEHVGGMVVLAASSPIGLLRTQRVLAFADRVIVHPAPAPVLRAPAGDLRDVSGVPSRSLAVAGIGTEVLGLREWRAGDSGRAVSARASARHGRPLVLDREREVSPALVVLVGGGSGPEWEWQLSLAAAFAAHETALGREVRLLGLPHEAGSTRTTLGVLDAFARADAVPTLGAATLHDAVLATPSGGVLVVVPGQVDVVVLWPGLRRAAAVRRIRLSLVTGPAGG